MQNSRLAEQKASKRGSLLPISHYSPPLLVAAVCVLETQSTIQAEITKAHDYHCDVATFWDTELSSDSNIINSSVFGYS